MAGSASGAIKPLADGPVVRASATTVDNGVPMREDARKKTAVCSTDREFACPVSEAMSMIMLPELACRSHAAHSDMHACLGLWRWQHSSWSAAPFRWYAPFMLWPSSTVPAWRPHACHFGGARAGSHSSTRAARDAVSCGLRSCRFTFQRARQRRVVHGAGVRGARVRRSRTALDSAAVCWVILARVGGRQEALYMLRLSKLNR